MSLDWNEIFGSTVSPLELIVRGTVTDGAILIGTIIGWNVLIDWLNYRVPALQHWLEPPPLLLVQNVIKSATSPS